MFLLTQLPNRFHTTASEPTALGSTLALLALAFAEMKPS
jgi:hypothetical protein